MSAYEGNFMEETSHWDPPLSPSLISIFTSIDQTNNAQNSMTEIVSQTNIPKDQSEQRSDGFGERSVSGIDFQLPTFNIENIYSLPHLSRNPLIVCTPNAPISPEFRTPTLLQSLQMLSDSSQIPLSPITKNGSLEMDKGFGEDHVTTLVPNNDLFDNQSMHADLPPQQDKKENHDTVNVDKDDDKGKYDVDEFDLGESSTTPNRKRGYSKRYERASNMVGSARKSKQQRVIIQMKSEDDTPDDGFRWRKYGEKIVKGNPNPRSYYICTYDLCEVKKHVERGAEDMELVVTTYDGIHKHRPPPPRGSRPRKQNDSKHQLDRSLPFMQLFPQTNVTQLYMTGLSKLPSDNQNSDLMHRNEHMVNQNSGIMFRDDHPFGQMPISMNQMHRFVDHNLGFVAKNNQLGNQNSGFIFWNNQAANQNLNFLSQNDHLGNHNLSFMHQNGQPFIHNFVSRNPQPVHQNPNYRGHE